MVDKKVIFAKAVIKGSIIGCLTMIPFLVILVGINIKFSLLSLIVLLMLLLSVYFHTKLTGDIKE